MQQVWLANGENKSLLHMFKDLLCGHFLDTQYLGTARIDKFDPNVLKRRYRRGRGKNKNQTEAKSALNWLTLVRREAYPIVGGLESIVS